MTAEQDGARDHEVLTGPAGAYEALSELGAATVHEASGGRGLIDIDLVQVIPGSKVAGPARIAYCAQDDNRGVHEVMTQLRPGEVLVLAMPQPTPVALFGELLAVQARQRGAVGVLVDAAVRDVDELRALGLPVWARFVRVRGTSKDLTLGIDVPVVVGGARICPGDALVLDTDGGVVVEAARFQGVLEASRARVAKEAVNRRRFETGESSWELYGFGA